MLDTIGDAEKISNSHLAFVTPNPANPGREFLDTLQTILDNGFQQATKSSDNFDISPPFGSLYINQVDSNNMPEEIGRACAEWWSKAINIGEPIDCTCGEVVEVTNDADKIAAPIAAGLRALGTGEPLNPRFFDFVNVIHNEIKTIIWTIHEVCDKENCDSVLTGSVS